MEYRKLCRYQLGLPVTFSWKDKRGLPRSGEGVTRDIGPGGMFIVSDRCPPPGSQVMCEVVIPRLYQGLADLQVRASGQVMRNDQSNSGRGFAVISDQLVLHSEVESAQTRPVRPRPQGRKQSK